MSSRWTLDDEWVTTSPAPPDGAAIPRVVVAT